MDKRTTLLAIAIVAVAAIAIGATVVLDDQSSENDIGPCVKEYHIMWIYYDSMRDLVRLMFYADMPMLEEGQSIMVTGGPIVYAYDHDRFMGMLSPIDFGPMMIERGQYIYDVYYDLGELENQEEVQSLRYELKYEVDPDSYPLSWTRWLVQ